MTDAKKRCLLALPRAGVICCLFILGTVLLAPVNLLSAGQYMDDKVPYLDISWLQDVVGRLRLGQIAGRDFIFTCGPAYQLLHAVGLLIPPGDIASSMRFFYLAESLLVVAALWGISGLFIRSWARRCAFVLAWCFFWGTFSLPLVTTRNTVTLFVVLRCATWLSEHHRSGGSSKWLRLLFWAGATPLFLLYTFDSGIYTALTALAVAAVLGLASWKISSPGAVSVRLRLRNYMAAVFAGLLLFILATLVLPGWQNFLGDSWETAQGYQWAMAYPLGSEYLAPLGGLLGALLLLLVGLMIGVRRQLISGTGVDIKLLALVAATCFALISFRGALTRSDGSHLQISSFPACLLLFGLLPCYLAASGRKWGLLLLGGILFQIAQPTATNFQEKASYVQYKWETLTQLGGASTTLYIPYKPMLDKVAAVSTLPDKNLMVWPDLVILNALMKKANPIYTVQCYAAHTPPLEEETIRNMEAVPNLPVLLPGGDSTLDGVRAASRTPLIFRYLLNRFELRQEFPGGVQILRPRKNRDALRWTNRLVGTPQGVFKPGAGNLVVNIPATEAPREDDFFTFQATSAKTSTFPAGKPGVFFVVFRFADGSSKSVRALLPQDGKAHDVLVRANALATEDYRRLFAAKPGPAGGRAVTGMAFGWQPMDLLSKRPTEIRISTLAVLRPESN